MRNSPWVFIAACVISSFLNGVNAVRSVHIKVPQAIVEGEDAVLKCLFDLEGDKLYSVKWYRWGWEFYRFIPSDKPPIKQFKIKGLMIHVREKDSGDHQIVLEKVTKEASGPFSCEVTADHPSFYTKLVTAELQVVNLPKRDPDIIGLKTRYRIGDILEANCTSKHSYPAANLTWYINGTPLSQTQQEHVHYKANPSFDGKYISAYSTITLKVTKDLFSSNGRLKIRCSASMYHLYHRSSEKSVQLEKKKHKSTYNWLATSSTTLGPFEVWALEITERPPQATVIFGGSRSTFSHISTLLECLPIIIHVLNAR